MLKVFTISALVMLIGISGVNAARSSSRNLRSLSEQKADELEKARDKAMEALFNQTEQSHASTETITFLGPKNGWGFVIKKASCYSAQGKKLGILDAGTLFKYHDVKSSSGNDMLLARIRRRGEWSQDCLLACPDVAAYEGDPEKVDIKIVKNLRDYFVLKAKVDSYEKQLRQRKSEKNPYYKSYLAVVKKYNESIAVAHKMKIEAEKLTGIRKTTAHENLRSFKYKQEQLKQALHQVGQKYKSYKSEVSINSLAVDDPELNRLKQELAVAKSKVEDLIPEEIN